VNLTVVIPTLDEEKDLPRTLESVKKLTKNILVIDSGSTDKTLDIAKVYGAKIVNRPFRSFSDTRNFANSKVKTDWILSIEADVVISSSLIKEIKEVISSRPKELVAYFIPRTSIIWGKKILHTDWGPKDDLHIWLYQKGTGSWQGKVHEEYVLKENLKAGQLTNPLIHYNYETVNEFIGKMNSYSNLDREKGVSPPPWWPLREFFKRYVYKRGYLDGYHGLFLSYLQAVYYHILRVKRYQKQNV
jgi:glycosyltransferase involved in cell wall biosynthesis